LREIDRARNCTTDAIKFIDRLLEQFIENLKSFQELGDESYDVDATEQRVVKRGFFKAALGSSKTVEVETEEMKRFRRMVAREARSSFIFAMNFWPREIGMSFCQWLKGDMADL